MGLEILEEFRPTTPIMTKTLKHVFEVETTNKVKKEDEQDCDTPTSSRPQSTQTFVCPPAPKKARVTRSNNYSAQMFFQVPDDLASVFVLREPILARRSKIAS
ncbi:unnamed protein product [Lathyrus oleraceus]